MSDGEPILSAEADNTFKKLKTVPVFRYVNKNKVIRYHSFINKNE